MEPPIIVRALDHYFGEGEVRRQVLFNLEFDIPRGALVVLMGASGSGKTTLLDVAWGTAVSPVRFGTGSGARDVWRLPLCAGRARGDAWVLSSRRTTCMRA